MSHDLISLIVFLLVFTGVIYVLIIYNKKLRAKINDNLHDSTRRKGETEVGTNNLNEQEFLSIIEERLKKQQYSITENVTHNNQVFDYVAKRTKFEVERFGLFTTFFILARLERSDIAAIKEFSAKAFKYARKTRGIYPPRGFGYCFICFPVAVVDSLENTTKDFIHITEPPKHWGGVEKLVVFSIEDNNLYYCEKTFMLGSMYYDWDRLIIKEMLSPKT